MRTMLFPALFLLQVLIVMPFGPPSTLRAQDPLPTPPAAAPTAYENLVTYENLSDLAAAISRIDDYRDNFYQYHDRIAQLHQAGREMEGRTIEVVAEVERVTPWEVVIDVPKAGRARVLLRHQRPPLFGNLGSRNYPGPPSTLKSHVFAKPVALRIGEEIDFALARQLRRGDHVQFMGVVVSMLVEIKSTFDPYVAAVVSDWTVVNVDFDSERPRVEY